MQWRDAWHPFGEGVTYLNVAGQAPLPKVAIDAAATALEAKMRPQVPSQASFFEAADRARAAIARMIGGRPEEVALTTGASSGLAVVALGLAWQTGDEVVTALGDFPLQAATWAPMTAREGLTVRVARPSGPYLVADDVIAELTPRTRLVSVALVRFDDGARLDARRLADACHAHGALLCLDVSQCCGAMPLDVAALGADFLVCAGYKWLLSPFGTGFFWMKLDHLDLLRPAPAYWMALEGARNFQALDLSHPVLVRAASRYDTPEWTSVFNFNLTAMVASLEWLLQVGPGVVFAHNQALVERLFHGLPRHVASPASPANADARGPYGCIVATRRDATPQLFEALTAAKVYVSLREGRLRVSPHLFNEPADIDRMLDVIAAFAAPR